MIDTETVLVKVSKVSVFPEEGRIEEKEKGLESRDGSPKGMVSKNHFLEDPFSTNAERAWKPAVNLFELNSQFVIEADLAGTNPEDLDIRVTPDQILIKAALRRREVPSTRKVYLYEMDRGCCERSVQFPKPINPGDVSAEFENGLLRVTAAIAE
jgi:HSP20 family molecular chaperone IbpA